MSKKKIVFAMLAFAGILAAGYWWNENRKESIRDAINPLYWIARWQGKDLFDYKHDILYHGNRKYREVAMTIDDGPHYPTGEQLLDIFKANGVHATFFMVGLRMKEHPEQVRRMIAEGHEAANHTMDHIRLNTLNPRQIQNEIRDDDINFNRITGGHLHLLRPPGMDYNNKILDIAKKMGYVTVSWDCAAKDYDNVSPSFIINRIMDRVENGSIILLHDDNENTVQAMPTLIADLKKAGYRFVTVSQLLADLPHPVILPVDKNNLPPIVGKIGAVNIKH